MKKTIVGVWLFISCAVVWALPTVQQVEAEIQQGHYVAQEYAAPSERVIDVDGEPAVRKTDVRLYVYDGEILLTAARLYQGQATNFRMPGSGFAPVFVI